MEGAARQRLEGAEVALVEGQQPAGAQAVRQDDDREVGQPDVQPGIPLVELEGQAMLLDGERFDQEDR